MIFVLLLLISACSSQPKVFKESEISKNNYLQVVESVVAEPENSHVILWKIFHRSHPIFFRNILSPENPQNLLNSLAPPVLRDDFTLTESGEVQHQSIYQSWWVDLVRFESSVLAYADANSINNYQAGACTDAYIKSISSSELVMEMPRSAAKIRVTEIWDKILPIKNPKLNSDLRDLFSKKKLRLVDAKTSEALFIPEILIVKTDDGQFWFVKEKEHKDFIDLKGKVQDSGASFCDRLDFSRTLKNQKGNFFCENLSPTKTLSAEPLDAEFKFSAFGSWTTAKDLEAESARLCAELASWHKRHWTYNDVKVLTLAFNNNPIIRSRILRLAEKETQDMDRSHRMWLEQNKNKNPL